MVEEVKADEVGRPARSLGQLADTEGRGVGGQDGPRLGYPVELGQEVGLDLLVLKDGLDDKVGLGRVFEIGGALDPAQDLVHLLLGEDSSLHRLAQEFPDGDHTPLHKLGLDIEHDDLKPLLGRLLGDARAHVAGPDHGHP